MTFLQYVLISKRAHASVLCLFVRSTRRRQDITYKIGIFYSVVKFTVFLYISNKISSSVCVCSRGRARLFELLCSSRKFS